jgi:argininosuccinate synthase
MTSVRKAVLAYSGGLDTSIILKWLQETYGCEVVTFTADLGQGEELEPARLRAESLGVHEIYVDDLREEFARDFVFPMFRANAIYEGEYLLGTSIARPLIAKRLVEIAEETGADAISHGATGKGNDQIRFELGAYALSPDVRVIAPWREWDLNSRESLLDYAEQHGIAVERNKGGGSPYSMDANLLHISYEGGMLEDPSVEPDADMWLWTNSPEQAPDRPDTVEIEFEHGDPVAIDGERMSPAHRHEIARLLRDARRYHPAKGAPRHGVDHARSRRGAPEGQPDALLRGADLQRLLVEPRTRDAAGTDRSLAAGGQRARAGEAVQGHGDGRRPRVANRQPVRCRSRQLRG